MRTSQLGKFCENALEAGWLLGVTITPVFFNVYSSRVFEPDKLTTLRALAVVMAMFWITRFLDMVLRKEQPLRFSWRTPMVLPALLTMVVYLISTVFSLVPYTSFIGSYQRLQGTFTLFGYLVLFFSIITTLETRAQLSRLITVLILNSLPVALYGIVQHNGLDPLPWAGDVETRVASNMGNAIFVAAYLIMIVPLTAARIVESFSDILARAEARVSDILRASGYIFILAVQVLTIWYAGSRGPWLGAVAACFLLPYLALIMLLRRAKAESPDTVSSPWLDVLKGLGFGLGVLALAGGVAALSVMLLQGKAALYVGGGLASLLFGGAWLYMVVERKGWRWLWIGWGAVGLAIAVGLILINIPGPIQTQVRKVPTLVRLTTITELQGGTGKVRGLIWQGTVKLLLPHEPLNYPDDRVDRWNILRPLVGYGPESMYVAYNSFYPPELGHYESRTASPDRSHNETLDSLVITGVLGLAVYLFTFISVFYWGFRWLGLMTSRRQLFVYLGLILASAVIFFLIAWRLEGAYLFAVAIPLGVLVGTMVFLTVMSFRAMFDSNMEAEPAMEQHPHAILLLGILATVIAHFVEINFGIAIAATRTTFWALAGLLVVLGLRWVPGALAVSAVTEDKNGVQRPRPQAQTRRQPKQSDVMPRWVAPVIVLGLAAIFLLGTLCFDFVNNPDRLSDISQIFLQSLTTKSQPEKTQAYGALMIFLFTFLLFGVVGLSEYDREDLFDGERLPSLGIAFVVYMIVTFVGFMFFGTLISAHQAGLTQIAVKSLAEIVPVAVKLSNVLVYYYGLIFFVLAAIGVVLLFENRAARHFGETVSFVVLIALLILSVPMIIFGSINLIRADIVYKQGGVFASSNSTQDKEVAIDHFKKALEYVPGEDYYYLFLGKAYLEMTQGYPVSFAELTAEQQESLLAQYRETVNWTALTAEQQAQKTQEWRMSWELERKEVQSNFFIETEDVLTKARDLNPLNTDHSANLARFYKSWAARISIDIENAGETERPALETKRQALLQQSLENYEIALMLSPNNPIIWNEKAQLYAIDLGDMANFQTTISRSLQVDEEFEQTWMLLGDMYSSRGEADQAITSYRQALVVRSNCTVWRVLGTLQAQQAYWADSAQTLEAGIEKCSASGDLWDFYRVLSIAYANLGQLDTALVTANQAYTLAPEAQKELIQQLLDSLNAQILAPTPTPQP